MSSPPPSFLCHHSHGRLGDGVAFPTGVRPAGGATGLVRVQGSRAGLAHGAAWRRSAQGSPAMGAHRRRDKRGSVLAVVAPETGPALTQGGECAGLGPKKGRGPSNKNASLCIFESGPAPHSHRPSNRVLRTDPAAQEWNRRLAPCPIGSPLRPILIAACRLPPATCRPSACRAAVPPCVPAALPPTPSGLWPAADCGAAWPAGNPATGVRPSAPQASSSTRRQGSTDQGTRGQQVIFYSALILILDV